MNIFERTIATACFSGYSHFAPGTRGTAVALFVYIFLPELSGIEWVLLIAATFFVGVYVSDKGEAEWGHDPGPIVIDEVAGFFVSAAFLPQSLLVGIAAFFGFRALDIIKPPPARQSEEIASGWGVMLDDLVAGAYVNAGLHVLIYLFSDSIGHLL